MKEIGVKTCKTRTPFPWKRLPTTALARRVQSCGSFRATCESTSSQAPCDLLLVGENTTDDSASLKYDATERKRHRSVGTAQRKPTLQHPGGQSLAASSSLYSRAIERKARMSPALTMFPAINREPRTRVQKRKANQRQRATVRFASAQA